MEINGKKIKYPGVLFQHKYDGLLSVSLFCGIISMLTGPVPNALFAYLTGSVFYPLFLATPLLICLFSKLFKACRDIRAFIVILFFSLIGSYISALSIQAAIYVRTYNMSIFHVPLLTMLTIGKKDILPTTISSYTFALIFTLTGIISAWDILYYKERCGKCNS